MSFACSTASVRTLPSEDCIHTVIVRDIEKHDAEEEAVEAAEEFCEERNRRMKNRESGISVGGPNAAGTAGMAGQQMTSGKDYTATLKFKCT